MGRLVDRVRSGLLRLVCVFCVLGVVCTSAFGEAEESALSIETSPDRFSSGGHSVHPYFLRLVPGHPGALNGAEELLPRHEPDIHLHELLLSTVDDMVMDPNRRELMVNTRGEVYRMYNEAGYPFRVELGYAPIFSSFPVSVAAMVAGLGVAPIELVLVKRGVEVPTVEEARELARTSGDLWLSSNVGKIGRFTGSGGYIPAIRRLENPFPKGKITVQDLDAEGLAELAGLLALEQALGMSDKFNHSSGRYANIRFPSRSQAALVQLQTGFMKLRESRRMSETYASFDDESFEFFFEDFPFRRLRDDAKFTKSFLVLLNIYLSRMQHLATGKIWQSYSRNVLYYTARARKEEAIIEQVKTRLSVLKLRMVSLFRGQGIDPDMIQKWLVPNAFVGGHEGYPLARGGHPKLKAPITDVDSPHTDLYAMGDYRLGNRREFTTVPCPQRSDARDLLWWYIHSHAVMTDETRSLILDKMRKKTGTDPIEWIRERARERFVKPGTDILYYSGLLTPSNAFSPNRRCLERLDPGVQLPFRPTAAATESPSESRLEPRRDQTL